MLAQVDSWVVQKNVAGMVQLLSFFTFLQSWTGLHRSLSELKFSGGFVCCMIWVGKFTGAMALLIVSLVGCVTR